MNFTEIISEIQYAKNVFKQSAIASINNHLTIRNWLIGLYIVEFEQQGEDRAKYGAKLLQTLSQKLSDNSLSYSNLKVYRQFYLTYPQFVEIIPFFIQKYFDTNSQSLIVYSNLLENKQNQIRQSPIVHFKKDNKDSLTLTPLFLLNKLSFTHFVQLLPIVDSLKRTFYENECIKGTWSVRELRRQIDSMYYERCGMSNEPKLLCEITQLNVEGYNADDFIKSPFSFEFLGLKSKDVVYESDLEQALIEHLEDFLLELGYGFCFESRQKRIVIGDEYYF